MDYYKLEDKISELRHFAYHGLTDLKETGLSALNRIFKLKKGYPLFVAGNPGCFCKGQLIHTSKGVKPIESIKVGDKVLSYNHLLKINEYKNVIATPVHEKTKQKIFKIKMKDGTEINVTEEHEFFTGDRYLQIQYLLLSLPKNK